MSKLDATHQVKVRLTAMRSMVGANPERSSKRDACFFGKNICSLAHKNGQLTRK